MFSAAPAEPLVVTLGDDEEQSQVVQLSDDDMEEGVGGPGIGYVNPTENQVQPPPEAPGFPSHDLRLKTNMPLMLLRNLNPREGLCNGTKLIFLRCVDNKLLECKIEGSQRIVFIPRITFIPKQGEYTFEWQRRQFPVKPAFAWSKELILPYYGK